MRIILEFYVPVFISVFFNVQNMELTAVFDYLSLISAATFSLNMLLIPAYYALVIIKNRNHLDDPDTLAHYGVLFSNLKKTSLTCALTYQFILLRRFLMVVVLCFCVFSLPLQIVLLILISAAAVPHMLLVRPFKELKDNLATTMSEVAFTVASTQLPLIAMKKNEDLAGDVLIYTLLGATILNGLICLLFMVPALVTLSKKYCNRAHKKVDI